LPELPEVETIRTELEPAIVGRTIKHVNVLDDHAIKEPGAADFIKRLTGKRIESIHRRGKYLLMQLKGDGTLAVHLKMSGALLFDMPESTRYVRVVFDFDDGSHLILTDKRRFARTWLANNEAEATPILGPEPLVRDFTYDVFLSRLKGRKAPIKAVLLDQKVIAGVGNMYADEALYSAKIHPLRTPDSLSSAESRRLYKSIIDVLRTAIGNKGASIESYVRPHGDLGTAHYEFRVAHQRGKTCPVCGTAVKRIVVRNRGTYFCPKCQV
jgi:formamidopyrimidine-DNA glycosylase